MELETSKLSVRGILWRVAVVATTAVGIAACSVGPDFKKPTPPKVGSYTANSLPASLASAVVAGGETQQLVSGSDIPAEWWTLFHNEPLNALITDALKSNPDLQSAKAALRVAMENVKAQEGAYFPTIQAAFAASRNQNSGPLSPALSNNMLLFNLYQAQAQANWT